MSTEAEVAAEAQRKAEKLAQIKTWATERGILDEEIVSAFGGDEPQPLPPNHTCVTWFDVFAPAGVKLHVVVRGGATRRMVLDTVFTASNAFGDLVEQGWIPADRRPRAEAEIAETTARVEEKLGGAKRKKTDGNGGPGTRTIEVESILKRVTDSGKTNYLVKGGPWKKFGVTAWPDSGQIYKLDAAVDLDKWAVGELVSLDNKDVRAVVQLKEGGKPGKVVDFVGADTLDDDPNI